MVKPGRNPFTTFVRAIMNSRVRLRKKLKKKKKKLKRKESQILGTAEERRVEAGRIEPLGNLAREFRNRQTE